MKPRRQSRRAHDRVVAVSLQRWRLERIARGELEPICMREEFFLRTLRDRGRADPADFIVPHPLLFLETRLELDEPEPADPSPPPPNPLSPPP